MTNALRALLVSATAVLAIACGTGGGDDGSAGSDVPVADVPVADVPPADVALEADPAPDPAPSDLPPADPAPADIPADLPPEDVPPADMPPADTHVPLDAPPEQTEPCHEPSFPADCEAVTAFQCGFQGECVDGLLSVDWHHHWFCDGVEEITSFHCTYQCPNGCKVVEYVDWPQDGQQLVADNCLPAPDCAVEGESVPVVPGRGKECCEGLVKVPCDKPNADGECMECDGAGVCTACGDDQCGKGENHCNCAADCANQECLGIGGKFTDFDTEGKCCAGLAPKSDCHPIDGGCSCPKCPCYVCLDCGDDFCDPERENPCNCPEDCPAP
ncbi:MAG: hypothetical protein FJ087_01820 [Deltaproteobacteria bacterium]|nr:hypothetical protein [Deltaproteobacteria bacterium]